MVGEHSVPYMRPVKVVLVSEASRRVLIYICACVERLSLGPSSAAMLSQSVNPLEMKVAEKLTILNDRAIGVLTRTSNIKKVTINFSLFCRLEIDCLSSFSFRYVQNLGIDRRFSVISS